MIKVEAAEDDADGIMITFDDETLQGTYAQVRLNGEHAVELTLQLWETWAARGYDPAQTFAALAEQRKAEAQGAPAAAKPTWWAWLFRRK